MDTTFTSLRKRTSTGAGHQMLCMAEACPPPRTRILVYLCPYNERSSIRSKIEFPSATAAPRKNGPHWRHRPRGVTILRNVGDNGGRLGLQSSASPLSPRHSGMTSRETQRFCRWLDQFNIIISGLINQCLGSMSSSR